MISVIIPAYNEEKNITACLKSISDSDFPKENFEIILVDNGSSDNTRNIAQQFNINILCNKIKNISGLRNLGAEYAKGDILAFVDADCVVSSQWLKNASVHISDKNLAAWGAPPVIPENATWVQKAWFLIRQKETRVQYVDWLESMNLFVRKNQFFNIGGFNESLETCEDVDFCYRIRKYGKIISDSNINVIHLGEAGTVNEFMKKEIWRGKSNLRGMISHGLKLKEIPSLAIPLYFAFFLPLLLFGFVCFKDFIWLVITIFFYFIPSAAVLYKVRKKEKSFMEIFGLLLLLQVYFFSRTIAVITKV